MPIYDIYAGIGGYSIDIMVSADTEEDALDYMENDFIPNYADDIIAGIEDEYGQSDGVMIRKSYDSEGDFYEVTALYDEPDDESFFREIDFGMRNALGDSFDELGYHADDIDNLIDPGKAGYYL